MANLKDIRKRIQSVKNTRQITRAMKMVAAAKLRRSQEAILNSRPYAYRIYSILLQLAHREGVSHPLLVQRPEKKIHVVILAGDRGLCGSFNASIFKEAQRFIKEKQSQGVEVLVDCIGKKAYDFFKKRTNVVTYHEGMLARANYNRVAAVADQILQSYATEEIDAIYLVFNEFKSAIQQKVTTERLVPVPVDAPEAVTGMLRMTDEDRFKNFLMEPSKEEILAEVVPRHFRMQFFRAVLESVASEHGARMSAMENASKNASEMIDGLTLQYNKARQAAITTELMEIVGGVEAMR
jgi:F-type H+-transporting ATPase subunit gamma